MLPPTFALSVFLMAATTLLVGMLLGWAWGSAAMASALSVRSASLFAQQSQTLKSLLDPTSPIPIARQIQIHTFHGIFLDPRSSAVYGAFLFIGTFAMGALRAYLPSLTLLSVFGSIVMDVACTTGPREFLNKITIAALTPSAVLPTAQYTIPEQLIIPTTFYVAVAIGTVILIFPESLSHVWLTLLLESFWTKTLDLLRLQSETLALRPSDHEAWTKLNARGTQLRTSLVAATDAVSDQLKLIDLDTSIGRLGPADLKKINLELKSIMFRAR
uniref:Putative ER transporter 6TM N-terminal domain-containing protein n=1 Tax=Psilocybe cubensis TaxID=181762 RepID=A0A8H7YBR5_PSICU